ncbi:MAG: hypothetical protein Q9187_008177, partial [Circinaria calcarea]
VKYIIRDLSGAVITFASGAIVHNIDFSTTSNGKPEMATIHIAWPKPSHTVTLLFETKKAARLAMFAIRMPDLSRLCHGESPEVEHMELPIPECHVIECKNIKPGTTSTTIASCLPLWCQPAKVFLKPLPPMDSHEPFCRDLCVFGALKLELVNRTRDPLHDEYAATFSCAVEASKATKGLDDARKRRPNGIDYKIRHRISITFTVFIGIFRAVEYELLTLVVERRDGPVHARFESLGMPDSTHGLATFRVSGEGPEVMAQLKRDIEQLLAGRIAKTDDSPIWTDYFSTPEGLEWLGKLGIRNACFIYRDKKRCRLALYARHGASDNRQHCIDILVMKVQAVEAEAKMSKEAIEVLKYPGAECPVCLSEASDPYLTSCEHVYCRACLSDQCSNTTENFPIRCLGLGGACGKPLDLVELQTAIPAHTFESLLRMSLESYIRKHSTTLRYCPTPDCNHLYRQPTDDKPFICPSCFSSACLSCQYPHHDGKTCEQYQDTLTGNAAFQEWKSQNGVKDCPKCAVPIQKGAGCNHTHCWACSTHFCWTCLRAFKDSGETYKHMTEAHGGFFDREAGERARLPVDAEFLAAARFGAAWYRAPVARMQGRGAIEVVPEREHARRMEALAALREYEGGLGAFRR